MLDAIRTLYAYNVWAHARILDTAAELTPKQFLARTKKTNSIRDALVHTAAVQWVSLERWQGRSPRQLW
jgi:uncharacterized damage-inducible protein DinB